MSGDMCAVRSGGSGAPVPCGAPDVSGTVTCAHTDPLAPATGTPETPQPPALRPG